MQEMSLTKPMLPNQRPEHLRLNIMTAQLKDTWPTWTGSIDIHVWETGDASKPALILNLEGKAEMAGKPIASVVLLCGLCPKCRIKIAFGTTLRGIPLF
jgi:hypothetical protein